MRNLIFVIIIGITILLNIPDAGANTKGEDVARNNLKWNDNRLDFNGCRMYNTDNSYS